ncbi:hypothetical protein DVH24_014251 [Malus domestica]|uniref:Myb-like domain-containing protein n=1 Tax=Malus domestica TaxID=3750 RepID=A0A498JFQ4_MALDO|nr:hypothetical protein DVH24_014251 [Malus domestica]
MASSAMKGRALTRKEDEALYRAYKWVSEDSVRGISQTSEGVWTRSSTKAYFDRKKKEIMSRRQLFTSDYTPTMVDDEDDVDYGYQI